MMQCDYPNLPLIEFMTKQMLSESVAFQEKWKEVKKKNAYAYPRFDTFVFPQIWGSTCLGFDVAKDGQPTVGGCAMTKAYTTIMHEKATNFYVVFFDGRACYLVNDPNERFFADMKNQMMASLKEANGRY